MTAREGGIANLPAINSKAAIRMNRTSALSGLNTNSGQPVKAFNTASTKFTF